MTAPSGGSSSAVVLAVGFLIAGALATAVFGWFTSRKSVAITELETALEYMRGEAEMARELRKENRDLNEQLSDVRTVVLGLQRRIAELEAQIGGGSA